MQLPQVVEPLKVWDKLEIVVGDDDKKSVYFSRIEDFDHEGLVVTAPEFQYGDTLLRDNCDVVVMVTKGDAIYLMSSEISRYQKSSKNLYFLAKPSHIKRVQRRDFVRIDYLEDASYLHFDLFARPK